MAVFDMEDEDNGFKQLNEKIKLLAEKGEAIVTNTLHNEGAELIKDEIDRLLPSSGRTWKGKKKAATNNSRAILKRDRESKNLNVVVGTTYDYHYLYFPDDGSNTVKHAGNQHFMLRGAENQAGNIIDLCIDRLTQAMNG